MKIEHEKGAEREYQKEIASRWQKRFDDALERVTSDEHSTLDQLLDVIWNDGILGRIAPTDPQEKAARVALQKDVWQGSRDDEELYWRILYSAGYVTEPEVLRHSTFPTGYASGAVGRGRMAVLMSKDRGAHVIPKEHQDDPLLFLAGKIMDRAREEIRKRGGAPHDTLIPWNAKATWNGMKVQVTRYTSDGLLYLKGESYQDHIKIGELTDFVGAISPADTDPKDWKKE